MYLHDNFRILIAVLNAVKSTLCCKQSHNLYFEKVSKVSISTHGFCNNTICCISNNICSRNN